MRRKTTVYLNTWTYTHTHTHTLSFFKRFKGLDCATRICSIYFCSNPFSVIIIRIFSAFCFLCIVFLSFLFLWTHLSAGQYVSRQFNLGEVAFADGFEQSVVSNVWLFIWTQGDGVTTSGTKWAAWPARALLWAAGRQGGMLKKERDKYINYCDWHHSFLMNNTVES